MRVLLFFFVVLISTSFVVAQDIHFSQFFANPMQVNPAFAGMSNNSRAIANYRIQWVNTPAQFTSASLAVDSKIPGIDVGIGFQFLNENQSNGILQSNKYTSVFSDQIQLTKKWRVALGAQFSYMEKFVDITGFVFVDQINTYQDELNPDGPTFVQQKIGYFDLGLGGILYSDDSFFGLSVDHIFEPLEEFSPNLRNANVPRKFLFHAGHRIETYSYNDEKFEFLPSFIYEIQGDFKELRIGSSLAYYGINASLWYRQSGIAIFAVGLKISPFHFGYSYDAYLVNQPINGGAHELTLNMDFNAFKSASEKSKNAPLFYQLLY